ncbi:zinc finger protein 583-like [Battus philenor]|uniref:zinc finger protein 583-like n=1 Tax=Battus philenor TaxID=42288 RepID=UPI0035CFCC60
MAAIAGTNLETNKNTAYIELVNDATNITQMTRSMKWEDELPDSYICRLCNKTFYNAMALQNHNNLQHDADASSSEADQNFTRLQKNEQIVEGLCGFKYVPREGEIASTIFEIDGLTKCSYNDDTSYIILKIEGDDFDPTSLKRSRLAGILRRNQIKQGKQPVDLRGPFTCTLPSTLRPDLQCRQIFFNCCEYSLHYREEHTKRRKAALRCQVCEKRLDRDFYGSNVVAPQITAPTPLTFSCRVCGQTFINSFEFDEHNRSYHAKMKPHQCTICAKRFTQQGGLQQHMRMHTGIRPFACTFCPKAFTQKAGLDQHLRTHTKVKPFKCVICSKCFSQSVHLRQHMRTHTNIQPFVCTVCGRRFKQSSHLNFHMRSHVGETDNFNTERYAVQSLQPSSQIKYLNFANLQQVLDGETLYYAAELAEPTLQSAYGYSSQMTGLLDGVL